MKLKTALTAAAALVLSFSCLQAEAKTVLRFATDVSRSDTQAIGAEHFIKLVSEKSNGNIEIKFYPDSTLGNSQSLVSGARSGTIDMAMVGCVNLSGLYAGFGVLDLPFIFKDKAHAYRSLDGEVGDKLYEGLRENGHIVGLAYFENGFRNITNSRKPIVEPADVEGLKIRVPQAEMLIASFVALGASPVPMAYGELYTAMETGAIEAQDHPMPTLFAGKFYEVQKYLSMTRHAYSAVAVLINERKFDKLSPEEQEILKSCAREAAAFQRDLNSQKENEMVEEMKKTGLEVNDNVNADAFMNATMSVRDIYIQANGDEYVKMIDATRNL